MQVDTGAFQALTAEVLARLDAVEQKVGRQDRIVDLVRAAAYEDSGHPVPPTARDRHGLRLVTGRNQ